MAWREKSGESLRALAARVLAYLAIHEGIALFIIFGKTFACSNGDVCERPNLVPDPC